jgi:hypothetical protein
MNGYVEVSDLNDPEFINILNEVIQATVARLKCRDLYVIQIDNWFDHKWLGFSGMATIASPFPKLLVGWESVKVEVRRDKVTLPPFNPNRILSQGGFRRVGDGYVEAELTLPHRTERRRSGANLYRVVSESFDSACLVWYSSGSKKNGRASIMVYAVQGRAVDAWFAGFHKDPNWKILQTQNITAAELADMFPRAGSERTSAAEAARRVEI